MLIKKKLRVVDEIPKQERTISMAIDRDSRFMWTTGADVMATWKKHGFVPPSEYRDDYLFKLNRDANKPTE